MSKHRFYRCLKCNQRFLKSMIARRGEGWAVCRECFRAFNAQNELDEQALQAALRDK